MNATIVFDCFIWLTLDSVTQYMDEKQSSIKSEATFVKHPTNKITMNQIVEKKRPPKNKNEQKKQQMKYQQKRYE